MIDRPLSGLLILCPTGNGLAYQTENTLDVLTDAGARKLRSDGNSCVAMHRCTMAQRALDVLTKEEPDRYSAVLWLDGDMVATVSHVRELMDLVVLVANCRPKPEGKQLDADKARNWTAAELADWRLRMAPALTGSYVKRNNPSVMAVRHVTPKAPPLNVTVDRGDSKLRSYELPAVVAGMGCLMQTRAAFLAHCSEAVTIENYGNDQFPAICASGPGKGGDGKPAWASEDWTYTSWEWHQGRGVYLVRHALFGHVGITVHYPNAETQIDE